MATKKTNAAIPKKAPRVSGQKFNTSEPLARKALSLRVRKDLTEEEIAREYARMMVSPELAAYRVLSSSDCKGSMVEMWKWIDVPSLTDELQAQAEAVNRGEMNHVEAMLINQATAMQNLFARLTERGMGCDHAPAFEANMRIALRAQSQCRATLETLAAIKNPPVVFAKQANISNGHQQINNGTPAPASHAGEIINQPNELLEVQHGGETVDSGATGKAIGKGKAMATVGKINRGADTGRQSGIITQRV